MITRERVEVFLLITLWSVLPMWGSLSSDGIAGSPYTDLYPSVWSLWATESWWGTWNNIWFGHPTGQPWSPSTVFWGTLIIPLKPLMSMGSLYNTCLLFNRVLSCIAFYMAGRSYHNSHTTGLLWMVVIAMNPMIHGFAVEGIIEGTQIWPLGFWMWASKKELRGLSVVFGSLIVLSNWYWSIVWVIVGGFSHHQNRKVWGWMLMSILVCSPWIGHFLNIQSNGIEIPPEIYRAMGFQFGIPEPHFQSPPNPFAQSNYIGWILSACTIHQVSKHFRSNTLLLIGIGFLLSIGFESMQSVPIIGSMRFPYRMCLLTFIGISMVLSELGDKQKIGLSIFVLLEFALLSPIDLVIPTSPSTYPDYTEEINGTVLELPGVLNRAPGEIDPSRPRMKRLMYFQTKHAQPSVWGLPFNGLNQTSECFAGTRIVDPQATPSEQSKPLNVECWDSIQWVVIHNNNTSLDTWLTELGFTKTSGNSTLPQLWSRP